VPSKGPEARYDIVLAPPELTKFPRRGGNANFLEEGIRIGSAVSMEHLRKKQKAIMQYREMKENKNSPPIS